MMSPWSKPISRACSSAIVIALAVTWYDMELLNDPFPQIIPMVIFLVCDTETLQIILSTIKMNQLVDILVVCVVVISYLCFTLIVLYVLFKV